jgi:odorant receptor
VNSSDLQTVTSTLSDISYGFYTVFKALWFIGHRKELTKLMVLLEVNLASSSTVEKTCAYQGSFKVFILVNTIEIFGFLLGFCVDPILAIFGVGEKSFSLNIWLLFDAFQPIVYETTFLTLTFLSVCTISLSTATDLLILTIFAIISKKFEELKEDFVNAGSLLGQEQHSKLKELIKRHQTLIESVGKTEQLISAIMLCSFMQSSFLICFCGFQVLTAEDFGQLSNFLSFLIAVLIQKFLICNGGQRLINSSQGIADAVYQTNWIEIKDLSIRKDLQLVMVQAQKGSRVTAGKFMTISLKSYKRILNSAYSYFTLLKTIWTTK